MRIAFGLVYFGLCLGKYEYLHGALHRATFSPPPKKAPAQKSSGSIIMIYDDWIHFSSSCSPFQSAIHWKVSWLGPRGRQFDPEMSSRWRLPRLERHRKLRLVLKQWVSRKLLLIFSFLHNRRDLFHFYFFSSCYFFLVFILHSASHLGCSSEISRCSQIKKSSTTSTLYREATSWR